MNVIKIGLAMSVTMFLFFGCSAKDLKESGGNVAFNNGSGNAVGMIGGLIVGGAMYGVGSAIDSNKEKSAEEQHDEATKKYIERQKELESKVDNNSSRKYIPYESNNGITSNEIKPSVDQIEDKQ